MTMQTKLIWLAVAGIIAFIAINWTIGFIEYENAKRAAAAAEIEAGTE